MSTSLEKAHKARLHLIRFHMREENGLRRIRFHDQARLREACCTPTDESPKDIQEWLGHSNISTTANIYTHLDFNSKLAVCQSSLSFFEMRRRM